MTFNFRTMLIKEKLGNLQTLSLNKRKIDLLPIEWYEATKRILHKQTKSGQTVTIKFLQGNPDLKEGEILWMDETYIIAVEIIPCACIVMTPGSMRNASSLCYEIGNKHLPLFYEGDELIVPYEAPLFNLLKASGYPVRVEERKLQNALKTSVLPHSQTGTSQRLFNKILQLTTPS